MDRGEDTDHPDQVDKPRRRQPEADTRPSHPDRRNQRHTGAEALHLHRIHRDTSNHMRRKRISQGMSPKGVDCTRDRDPSSLLALLGHADKKQLILEADKDSSLQGLDERLTSSRLQPLMTQILSDEQYEVASQPESRASVAVSR